MNTQTPNPKLIDEVEIKVFFDPSQFPQLEEKFHLHQKPHIQRVSCFFDTPSLHLLKKGVTLRIRLHRKRKDSLTLKLRNLDSHLICQELYDQSRFRLKVNQSGKHQTHIAKLETRTGKNQLKQVVAGEKEIRKALNRVQKKLFRQYTGSAELLDQLKLYRIVEARIWKWYERTFPHRLTLEEWFLPSRILLLELSIKVNPLEAEAAQKQLYQWLERQNIDYDLSQHSKTVICMTTQNQ
ncbi:MAG: CYTH domain-containing protein [Cyanobacteria bacterium J06592_8]